MKTNFLFFILFGFIFILLIRPAIIAPGPNYHLWDLNEILKDPSVNITLISQIINNNYDSCLCGLEYPDVTIFEYYTNFKVYAQMHNYNVVDEMLRVARNDRDRSFAYCYKIHLATDGASHNFFVPQAIKSTLLPNYIIHGPKELAQESRFLNPVSQHMMENHQEFDWLVTQATGRDWSSEAEKLNIIIGGGNFYSQAYAPETQTFWGKSQNILYKTVGLFVSAESTVDLEKLSIEESKAVLRGETPSLNPSGEEALAAADAETKVWLYLVTFLILVVIFFLSFRWRIIGFSKEPFKIR